MRKKARAFNFNPYKTKHPEMFITSHQHRHTSKHEHETV